ncbi:succinyldiaminopimelate transaminase [Planctomonas psychrotolerans]|uniref:succinyldiaminopimelate transaminase n=1 Tax=Planctomonas psychrotolerans TaxID=2528712 RepID=UPI001239F889|nr:succinyldiaminopimelate transaminase [Planctomonas psychrotolerans]
MLGTLPDYPWDLIAPFAERARRHPDGIVDLSIGSPVDPTPENIRIALAEATDAHAYPTTVGTAELRESIVDWFARRRNVTLDVDSVLPTIGSKEMVAWLPFMLGLGAGDVVVQPSIAYPTYAIGAALAGADVVSADDPADWPDSTRLVWLNSPSNPDGRVLDVDALRAAVVRARELGAVIANDECYAELGWGKWADAPTPCILDPRVVGDDATGVVALYSLSKQSNLAGYRGAVIAGDRSVIDRLISVRKHAGLMVPAPLQHAMSVAFADDGHVAEQRERYRVRREKLLPALEGYGLRVDSSEAGLYLWATAGEDAWTTLGELADLGILAGPGPFYGDASPHHVRLSLTATDERIDAAVARLSAARAG